MAYIELHDVVKDFKIKNRRNGAFGNVKNFFAPQYLTKRAVDHISLEINRGEMVGYIGPNGAGKSTTIKMLTGILLPTSGYVKVGNLEPYKNRKQNALHRLEERFDELKEKCRPFLDAMEHFPDLVKIFADKVRELFSIKEARERKAREEAERKYQAEREARKNQTKDKGLER